MTNQLNDLVGRWAASMGIDPSRGPPAAGL
jgi:hypothetical protein